MIRRGFLIGSGGVAATALVGMTRSFAAQDPAMQSLCDRSYEALIRLSPILCTTFGVDKGAYAALKSQIEGDAPADREAYARLLETSLKDLSAVERARLTGMDRINFDTLKWQWEVLLSGVKDFPYGVKGPSQPQSPYVISHLTGMAQALPDFFDSNHQIATRDDAEAYLARLERFGPVLESELGHFQEDVKAEARPPGFLLKRAIASLKGWRGQSDEASLLVASLVRRTREKNIAGDWAARAKAILAAKIHPALESQIAALEAELPRSNV